MVLVKPVEILGAQTTRWVSLPNGSNRAPWPQDSVL